jgi:CRP-like cAMP-binding protein
MCYSFSDRSLEQATVEGNNSAMYNLIKPYISTSHQISLNKGSFIYSAGDLPQNLFFIESGIVGLTYVSEMGKETFLRIFTEKNIFGHRSLLAKGRYHGTTTALTDVNLTCISKDEYTRIVTGHPELLLAMTELLSKELGIAEIRMSSFADKSARSRIVESYIHMRLLDPDHDWQGKEIASFAGSTVETVARVLSSLIEKGHIQKEGKKHTTFNIDKLLQYAKDIY